MQYEFLVPDDEPVAIGDLFVIDDTTKRCRFFSRVNEIRYNIDSGGLPSDHLIQIIASPIGYTDTLNRFRKPRIIPTRLSPVHYPDAEDILFLRDFMGEIEIGNVVCGQEPVEELPVRIPAQILTQHMGVFGTTGMGKSNLMKVFAASTMNKNLFGMLLVDPHGEYLKGVPGNSKSRGLIHNFSGTDGLSIYTIRNDLHYDNVNMKRLWLDHDDLVITDLNLIFHLSDQEEELIDLLIPFKGRDILGFFIEENVESLPSSAKTTAYIGNYQDISTRVRGATPGALQAVQRQIQTLLEVSSGFLTRHGSVLPDIIEDLMKNKVVLVDIPHVSEISELFILSVISRVIMDAYKHPAVYSEKEKQHQVLIAIEEAQRVLSGSQTKSGIFREIAMEGRKFGVGICVITQQPKNIDPRVLAQINTLLVLGLADQNDRDTLASSAKHDLRIMDIEIQTLDRGDAILSTIGIPFPVSCRIHEYERYLLTLTQSHS